MSSSNQSIIITRLGQSFDRNAGLELVQQVWNTSTSSTLFILNSSNLPDGTYADPRLTYEGCLYFCGDKMGFHPDSGARLLTWLLPMIILLANFQFSPVGSKRYLSVFHLLGNPIGSMLCLLLKMKSWNQSFDEAEDILAISRLSKRHYGWIYLGWIKQFWKDPTVSVNEMELLYRTKSLGVVIAALKEVSSYLGLPVEINTESFITTPKLQNEIRQTAQSLINLRTYELRRTILSIILYILQLLAGFIQKLGDGPSPSGGRIGPAMLLSWILPVVLLSNVVGDHASHVNLLKIVQGFLLLQQSNPDFTPISAEETQALLHASQPIHSAYFDELAWSGAMNTSRFNSHNEKPLNLKDQAQFAFLSSFPVVIAFVTAFGVLLTAPSYFSCRHILITSIFAAWVSSPFLSLLISTSPYLNLKSNPQKQFRYITAKDALIACALVFLLVFSSCGLFNNCRCWIGFRGSSSVARITPMSVFEDNNKRIYPIWVGSCLGAQGVAFGICALYGVGWGRGLRMMWWRGEEGRKVW